MPMMAPREVHSRPSVAPSALRTSACYARRAVWAPRNETLGVLCIVVRGPVGTWCGVDQVGGTAAV